MNNNINQSEDHKIDQNIQQIEKGTLYNFQSDSKHINSQIDNQSKSSQNFDKQGLQDEQNDFTLDLQVKSRGFEHQNITFSSEKQNNKSGDNYFHSPSKKEDLINYNQFNNYEQQDLKEYHTSKCNEPLKHKEQFNDDNIDNLQEQRKQKIRELEQKLEQAQKKINEKEEEIKINEEIIINFENFILTDYNHEEFEKIILSESNFETDNLLKSHLIKKLRQILQEFQNSIIDLINKFDGKTELDKDLDAEKDREIKDYNKHLQMITKEFKKFTEKQQKIEICDNKNTITIQNLSESEQQMTNNELNLLISNIISQTKLLRDILQKNCCQLIKFNCEIYNGLQGMSKNIKQLEQIKNLTNSVKLKTQNFQSIINDEVDLQKISDDNDHILLLDLLKQLINKQEQAFNFQQSFKESLFERIDLVHQSEDNLREDMTKRFQTIK